MIVGRYLEKYKCARSRGRKEDGEAHERQLYNMQWEPDRAKRFCKS